MNIIEAVKSGKRFQRYGTYWYDANKTWRFSREEILSDDWEIEQKKVEVDKGDVLEAWANIEKRRIEVREHVCVECGLVRGVSVENAKDLCRELGL